MLNWEAASDRTWVLFAPDSGQVIRQIVQLGPYLGQADPIYRVFEPGSETTDHASLAQAMTVAEASVAGT